MLKIKDMILQMTLSIRFVTSDTNFIMDKIIKSQI